MQTIQNTFMRYEIKYQVSSEQRRVLTKAIEQYMNPDEFGKSTICNVYYDTPDMRMVRHSIGQPVYKEKLRMRSYGRTSCDSSVFVEIKKKCQEVVYKRRVSMPQAQAEGYLAGAAKSPKHSQIVSEIDYILSEYKGIAPAVYVAYDRTAYFGKEDSGFRITFDENVLWRDTDLSLSAEVYGKPLLDAGQSLMEIKISSAMPLWLSHTLCELGIYKCSFSKYGNAYKAMLNKTGERGYCCA
jgi:hypothetical protein